MSKKKRKKKTGKTADPGKVNKSTQSVRNAGADNGNRSERAPKAVAPVKKKAQSGRNSATGKAVDRRLPGDAGKAAKAGRTDKHERRKQPQRVHYYDLDMVRALSCIAVLLYHLGLLKGGYLAVCTFFVLSGFLSVTSALQQKEFSFKKYYGRRLVQTYLPLAAVTLITVLVITMIPDIIWLNLKPETGSVLLGYNNWWQLSASLDYFARHVSSPFMHFWYVAIQLQFDLLFPVLFVFLKKVREAKETVSVIRDVIEKQVFVVTSGLILSLLKMAKESPIMFEILIKKMQYPFMSYSEIGNSMNPKCSKQNVLYHLKHAVELYPDLNAAILTDTRFSAGHYALTTIANRRRQNKFKQRIQGILYGEQNPGFIARGLSEITKICSMPFMIPDEVINFNPFTDDEEKPE